MAREEESFQRRNIIYITCILYPCLVIHIVKPLRPFLYTLYDVHYEALQSPRHTNPFLVLSSFYFILVLLHPIISFGLISLFLFCLVFPVLLYLALLSLTFPNLALPHLNTTSPTAPSFQQVASPHLSLLHTLFQQSLKFNPSTRDRVAKDSRIY